CGNGPHPPLLSGCMIMQLSQRFSFDVTQVSVDSLVIFDLEVANRDGAPPAWSTQDCSSVLVAITQCRLAIGCGRAPRAPQNRTQITPAPSASRSRARRARRTP